MAMPLPAIAEEEHNIFNVNNGEKANSPVSNSSSYSTNKHSISSNESPPRRSLSPRKNFDERLDELMKNPNPDASALADLIPQRLAIHRGNGFKEPARAVGKMQYIAGKLRVDAIELTRIRDMIKEYGKKIGVYKAKAHRELKKYMKQNTRRLKHKTDKERAVVEADLQNIRDRKQLNVNARKHTTIATKPKEDEDEGGFYFNSASTSSGSSDSKLDQF